MERVPDIAHAFSRSASGNRSSRNIGEFRMENFHKNEFDKTESKLADLRRDQVARLALATPPISNEDILKRSKESHGK